MARIGKPNATGRSSGKRQGRAGEAHRPPLGEPWVWLTRELVASPAWRTRSRTAIKFVDFLLIEYMNHAGTENGNLTAPYNHLVTYGCPRRLVSGAIAELQFLGLVEVTMPGGRWAGTNQPSRYRLTWLPDSESRPPTNEWMRITEEDVADWRRGQKSHQEAATSRSRKRNPSSRSGTSEVPQSELRAAERGDPE